MTATPTSRLPATTAETAIVEYANAAGEALRLDRTAGVIRGVKLLGLTSRNRRRYTPQALRAAASLYEGAKVNVNHPKGHPASPRDYQDRLGTVRAVEFREGAGLFADLHFNPKHALAEQLQWDAEQAPYNVGFSHNVQAVVKRVEGELLVERITQVNSVDLVADPATTRGLFESEADHAAAEQVAALREENAELRRELAASQRRHEVSELLVKFNLPPLDCTSPREKAITSELFIEQLLTEDSPGRRRQLAEERAALCRSVGEQSPTGPQSRGPEPTTPMPDARSFAAAIT